MGNFKVPFDINNYIDILPSRKEYLDKDFIINYDDWEKGNVDNCIWEKHIPTAEEIKSIDFRAREKRRILKTGAWIAIKNEILFLPPSYYFMLQYGRAGSRDVEFRLKRLMHVYFKIRARNNPRCIGTLTQKNRGDGETVAALTEALWECADGGETLAGNVGIQSKTNDDALNPCWAHIKNTWANLDGWIKDLVFSDMSSGSNIAEKMEFLRMKDQERGIEARHIILKYYPAVHNAMDSKHDVVRCILDEVAKWKVCSFNETFTNYTNFIMPGFKRKGIFDMFSSPADFACKSNEEVYALWKKSNTNEIDPVTNTTLSGVHRYYSNPLHGIDNAYDKWGDADADEIYYELMRKRKAADKDKLLGVIRANPIDKHKGAALDANPEDEMFDSTNSSKIWANTRGISSRKLHLSSIRFKDEKTKEPKAVFGNLERVDGYIDGEVEFRMTDRTDFDLKDARFCFSYLPQQREPLKDIFRPPSYVENCLGVDPYNNRYETKNALRASNGAMVNRKFADVFQTGYWNCPTMIYCCRPQHQETFFEDCIMAAIFNRAYLQYENRSDKLANFCEDRGYDKWLLPEIGASEDSKRKGDAPGGGKNAFLNTGIQLIDANTNVPLREGDPYWLEYHWFEMLLDQYLSFNPLDTHTSDLVMADIQSLIGCIKILHKKVRTKSAYNDAVLSYLLS